MGLAEYRQRLTQRGVDVTEAAIRFAMKNGRIPTPRVDPSRRFDFSENDVEKAVVYFSANPPRRRELAKAE